MSQISISVGSSANDGLGTNRREAFEAIEANFDELNGAPNGCINIGFDAGTWETAADKLFITSLTAAQQVNEATARTKAIIYGFQSATTGSQTLDFNAIVTFNNNLSTGVGVGATFTIFDDGTGGFNNRVIMGATTTGAYIYGSQGGGGNASLSLNASGGGNIGLGGVATTTSLLNITGLPTSSAGLAAGDVWANSGVLTIV